MEENGELEVGDLENLTDGNIINPQNDVKKASPEAKKESINQNNKEKKRTFIKEKEKNQL